MIENITKSLSISLSDRWQWLKLVVLHSSTGVSRAAKVGVIDILAHSESHRLGTSLFSTVLSTFHIDRNVTKSPTHDHINKTLTLL